MNAPDRSLLEGGNDVVLIVITLRAVLKAALSDQWHKEHGEGARRNARHAPRSQYPVQWQISTIEQMCMDVDERNLSGHEFPQKTKNP
ncbi:hypothetical protein TW79_05135 [Tritonibacter mobilis]|uniref:Uncharacterized protein n=1 Tax=Tritonibacter mobilis F1926 TaxID=1265309 RepID=A0A1B1A217_9RHOB|nr:hypothetical protein K529_007480 [Tritonibacter mobilis F1926]KJZ25053.1 hypothetical protein TW79_05135 [Tritonibacter mobilis]